MRARERARIARARAELRAARRARLRLGDLTSDDSKTRKKAYRAYTRVEKARANLKSALVAPWTTREHDIRRRPGRYKNPRAKLEEIDNQREKALATLPNEARFEGSTARALDLVKEALRAGRSWERDELFRKIARETGLSARDVYTMFRYLDQTEISNAA